LGRGCSSVPFLGLVADAGRASRRDPVIDSEFGPQANRILRFGALVCLVVW
jgi:hypothetical protein